MTDLNSAVVIDALAGHPSLRRFVCDRKLQTMPARMSRRRELLDVVAQALEPGIRYPERAVDDFLRMIHSDHAALRRYLADKGFLGRADGVYWRIGGSVPV